MEAIVYPGSKRTAEIRDELQQLEGEAATWAQDVPRFLRNFSSIIRFAARSNVVSGYKLRDWIWIGSQLRINSDSNANIFVTAGRLILYVVKQFERLRSGDEGARADIRWATDYTVSKLLDELGVVGFRSFMSSGERRQAEDQWLRLYESDNLSLDTTEGLQLYLKSFDDVSSECYLPDLSARIRALERKARTGDDESRWAAAALAYLVTAKDIIPDGLGYFGLVDDIFVLDQAFAMCCRQSPWLFLLDSFVSEWPDIARTIIAGHADFSPISQYEQAVIGSVLFSMTHGSPTTSIVVPQSGEIALSAAFFASLVAARKSATVDLPSAEIQPGADILLTSANRTVKARYKGMAHHSGQVFHMVELTNGSRSVTPEYLDAMKLATKPHKQLSTSKEFQRWHDEYSPILLDQLLRTKLCLDELIPEVLLVTSRNRLEWWLKRFRPMGITVPELIGIRYFMRTGLWEDLAGTIGRKPLLFVCNDVFTAAEVIRSKDESQACDKLRWIIVDVPTVTGDFGELQDVIRQNGSLRCVYVSGLEQVEFCRELGDDGAEQLYVAPDGIGVLGPRKSNAAGTSNDNVFMEQIRCQATKETKIVEIQEAAISELHDLAMMIRQIAKDQDNSGFEILGYNLRQLLRKLSRSHFPLTGDEVEEFSAIIDASANVANLVKAYHPDIERAIDTLLKIKKRPEVIWCKHRAIVALLSQMRADDTTLFCSSQTQKERLAEKAVDLYGLNSEGLATMRDLRSQAPCKNLVIPGWFDKKQMRELRVSGFAENYFLILYPFERSWEEVSTKAQKRWSSRLINATSDYAKRFARTYTDFAKVERWPTALAIEPEPGYPEEGVAEWPSQRLAAALTSSERRPGDADETVKARLVLFDDPEYFAFLSPGGKAICIPDMLVQNDSNPRFGEASAESLLNRPVAEIRAGTVLAFPESSSGDLLDSLADEILDNSPGIRKIAGRWRESLRHYKEAKKVDLATLDQQLRKVGVERHIATIRHWLLTDETIAPRSWRKEIPLIGTLTDDRDLTTNFAQIADAIERIYQARRDAADLLLEQLKTGQIDVERGVLMTSVKETQIRYRVLRVARIDKQADVAPELVGKVHSIAKLSYAA